MIIDSTGYIATLAEAKTFAKQRYGKDGIEVEIAYPPSFCDGIKHKV